MLNIFEYRRPNEINNRKTIFQLPDNIKTNIKSIVIKQIMTMIRASNPHYHE